MVFFNFDCFLFLIKSTGASGFWAFWAPHAERSRLVGIASSGAKIGNILALSIGGVLCLHGFGGGWPRFYFIFQLFFKVKFKEEN